MTGASHFSRRKSLVGAILASLVLSAFVARPAEAQIGGPPGRSAPSATYFLCFQPLYEGEYKDALEAFENELSGGIKTTQSRWIDSICYYTMVGECHYRMGNYPKALENYDAALRLLTAYPDWMVRVQFPDSIRPATTVRGVPWGKSQRTARVGNYPSTMLIAMGRIDNEQVVKRGGVVQQAMMYSVQVQEVVRCSVLALHRRRELLGPIAPHDPLTNQVLTALERRGAPPNHWSQAWIDVQLGMAYAVAGKNGQAIGLLQRSLLAAGEYDHPMTGPAMLALGQIALETGDLNAAATYFEEATYTAAEFANYTVLEEALRYGQLTHLLSNRKGIYPPLEPAAAWSRTRGQELHASVLALAAENVALLGGGPRALALLAEAKPKVARRSMGACEIGARLHYATALTQYRAGNSAAGDDSMAAAMQFYKSGSRWLFQIALVDSLAIRTGGLTPRTAMKLYQTTLREPTASDWAMRPLECLSVLLTPHPGPYERWFESAWIRKDWEEALEIADRTRRHRFYSSQPLGGRLLGLRWLLEAPEVELDKKALLQRADLLVRYPAYAKLADQARAIQDNLKREPLVLETPEGSKAQSQLLAELGRISVLQEAMLREIAVRREGAEMVFPPLRTTKSVQGDLPERHLLLMFFATSRHLYGTLLSKDKYAMWQVAAPADVQRHIIELLRSMGQYDANREVTSAQLAEAAWREHGQHALRSLLAGSKVTLGEGCDELIIVPDGMLWYLPFEALPVGSASDSDLLLTRCRVRYVPTMGLALPRRQGRKAGGSIAVALGKLYPRVDAEVAVAAFDDLHRAVPAVVALKTPLPAPSPVYKTLFDGLIVLDDLVGTETPYGWAPVPLDKSRGLGALANWLSLPWGTPDHVVLPGYHTSAETALRRGSSTGQELFLSTCGLMATGTRTVLLSRWRTGGQTSFDLVREFTRELPYGSASDAWQRSVEIVRQSPVNADAEPRVKQTSQAPLSDANHPFFWAGYLLMDTGSRPISDDVQEEEAPKLDFERQAAGE